MTKKKLLLIITWSILINLYGQDTIVKVEFIYLPFELITDAEVQINDTDYQDYIQKNKDWIFAPKEMF